MSFLSSIPPPHGSPLPSESMPKSLLWLTRLYWMFLVCRLTLSSPSPLLLSSSPCTLSLWSLCYNSFLEHTPLNICKTKSCPSFKLWLKPHFHQMKRCNLLPGPPEYFQSLPLLSCLFLHSTDFLQTYYILALLVMLTIYWLSSPAKIKAPLVFFVCFVLYLAHCSCLINNKEMSQRMNK